MKEIRLGDEARLRWFGGGRKRNEDLQAGGPKRRFRDGGNPSNWNEPGTFIKQMQISIQRFLYAFKDSVMRASHIKNSPFRNEEQTRAGSPTRNRSARLGDIYWA